jgi:hypothetical protein
LQGGKPALGGDEQEGDVEPGLTQEPAQSPDGRQVTPTVDQQRIAGGGVEKCRGLGRHGVHVVREQAQGRKHL